MATPAPAPAATLRIMTAPRGLLALVFAALLANGAGGFSLARYTPVRVAVPVGNGGASGQINVYVPNTRRASGGAVADPRTLFRHVQGVWEAVVEENQAGLVDAKYQGAASAPLSAREAWHHYTAGQRGVIDSARFLIAFSVVPSVQSGGSALHTAAAHNDVSSINRLLGAGGGDGDDTAHLLTDVDEEKAADGTTPLFTAVALGHEEATRRLLEQGANPNHVAQTGVTPLMVAASFGHLDIARLLVETGDGVDLNYQHTFALTTAMHFAAEMGRVDIVRYLCMKGADPHARKKTGGTPLHTASDTNQSTVVAVLLSNTCGARHTDLMNGDTSPLYLAAQRGFSSVLRILLAHGADVDFVMPNGKFAGEVVATGAGLGEESESGFYRPKNMDTGNGATALHAAVENGHLDAAGVLLNAGAKQLTSMQGASPLLIALQYRHPDIALRLVQDGDGKAAKINVQTPHDGSFPLLVAAKHGYKRIVRRLIQVGATLGMTDRRGESALSTAIRNGRTDIVQQLMRRQKGGGDVLQTVVFAAASSGNVDLLELLLQGYDGNVDAIRDQGGRTLLFHAVRHGHEKIAHFLLEVKGADATVRQRTTGLTPLMLAAQQGHQKLVKMLIKAGGRVNDKASGERLYGATALYLACQNGKRAVAKTLLKNEADVDARLDQIGVTPLFISVERGNFKMAKLLLKYNATVHFRNWNGITAFAMAMLAGDKTKMKLYDLLLEAGSEIDTEDNDGMTPLSLYSTVSHISFK